MYSSSESDSYAESETMREAESCLAKIVYSYLRFMIIVIVITLIVIPV